MTTKLVRKITDYKKFINIEILILNIYKGRYHVSIFFNIIKIKLKAKSCQREHRKKVIPIKISTIKILLTNIMRKTLN